MISLKVIYHFRKSHFNSITIVNEAFQQIVEKFIGIKLE
jgi:hypothetical protein